MKPLHARLSARALVIATLAVFAACSDRQPTFPPINAAKPGPGGDPTVTSADPDNAPQDTTLDVHVFGTDFDRGSQAQWARGGVPSAKVVTNSTRFVSSTELVANITIAVDADTGLYDIVVTAATGKKGIGTELFTVKPGVGIGRDAVDPVPLRMLFRDAAGDKLRSDDRFGDPNYYVDGQCGVLAYFPSSGSGDAILWPNESPVKGKEATACGGRAPRFIRLVLDDPVPGVDPGPTLEQGAFTNIDNAQRIAIGATELRAARINHSFCGLRFNPSFGGDLVQVTRVDQVTWRVATQPSPNDKVFCDDGVRGYHMPFAITITVK